jgi:hypothetical protein
MIGDHYRRNKPLSSSERRALRDLVDAERRRRVNDAYNPDSVPLVRVEDPEPLRCEQVSGTFTGDGCPNPGVVEYDGRRFCRLHDPSRVSGHPRRLCQALLKLGRWSGARCSFRATHGRYCGNHARGLA